MSKTANAISKPNDAWIFHREEFDTKKDGFCNCYFLLDAHSNYGLGHTVARELPTPAEFRSLLQKAHQFGKSWPGKLIVSKKDPCLDLLASLCAEFGIPFEPLPPDDVLKLLEVFLASFMSFKTGGADPLSPEQEAEARAFIPDAYSPCSCSSGKKFRFCCQPAFRDLASAMCAAQEMNKKEMLRYMKIAESKVGKTAEILYRYAVGWSYFDNEKSLDYLNQALALNPNHPRAHYTLGLEAKKAGRYEEAVIHYKRAIDNYPKEDRFHLNESYNNLGTAYYEMKNYAEAKATWEQALILLPSDQMTRENLVTFIYENTALSDELRTISPFVGRFLRGR
jgi:hypothetical protein